MLQGEQLNLMQSWLGDLIDQYNTRPQQQSFPAPDLPLRLCDKLDGLGSGGDRSLSTSQACPTPIFACSIFIGVSFCECIDEFCAFGPFLGCREDVQYALKV